MTCGGDAGGSKRRNCLCSILLNSTPDCVVFSAAFALSQRRICIMTRRHVCARSACFCSCRHRGTAGTEAARHDLLQMVAGFEPRRESRSAGPDSLLHFLLGHHPLQAVGLQPIRAPVGGVPRGLPPQQQVLGSAGGLQDARREPARRHLPGRLRRAQRPAARTRRCRRVQPAVASASTIKSLAALDRALLRAAAVEVNKLESRVPFLATTASITPTSASSAPSGASWAHFRASVKPDPATWASLRPRIAEALIATAAGLFAAIPAVYFYNHLSSRVKLLASEMDDFSLEFLTISERNFT